MRPVNPILTIALILLWNINAIAGKNEFRISYKDTLLGKTYRSQAGISSKQVIFPTDIIQYDIDSTNNELFFVLRNGGAESSSLKGYMGCLELSSGTVKWSKNIGYFRILHSEKEVLYADERGTTCYDRRTGKQLWWDNIYVSYIIPGTGIGLTSYVDAIDLHEGHTIWKKRVKGTLMPQEPLMLGGNVLLQTAAGIYSFNLQNGEGWHYEAQLQTKDGGGVALTIFAGMMFGIPGVLVGSSIHEHSIKDVGSGILLQDGNIYFSDIRKLVCLSTNGQERWVTKLPKAFASPAHVFIRNDRLFLLNEGVDRHTFEGNFSGSAYFAGYDPHTGQQIFFDTLGKSHQVDAYSIMDNILLMVIKDTAYRYDLANGRFLEEKRIVTDRKQMYTRIADAAQCYLQTPAGTWHTLPDAENGYYICDDDHHIYHFTNDLSRGNPIATDSLWYHYATIAEGHFLARKEEMILLDGTQPKAWLPFDDNAVLSGNKLYGIHEDRLYIVPVEQLK